MTPLDRTPLNGTRPLLLDLFCGAGGCSVGYTLAGFDVLGVDINLQPNYPFEFIEGDAIEFLTRMVAGGTFEWKGPGLFDAVHASPPCHAYSTVTGRNRKNERRYPDLIAPTRDLLMAWGKPWVMENVIGAPLTNAVQLCGSSFGLDVRRHRLFESSASIMALPCAHSLQKPRFRSLDSRMAGKLATVVGVHGHLNYPGEFELRCEAMGISWMTNAELTQAIPPAYTEHIGGYLMAEVEGRIAA